MRNVLLQFSKFIWRCGIIQAACMFVFYFSAVIEHTNQVIYLEDDDVAAVKDGSMYFY